MNPYRKAATMVHNIKCKLRNIEYADRGVERYVKMYKDPARRARYKAQFEEELKELGEPKFTPLQTTRPLPGGRKKGGKNRYYCSDGERVTKDQIKSRLTEAYKKKYGTLFVRCEETGEESQGSSHIISQKRCQDLHMSEMIWNPNNFYPATHKSNSRWESNDSTLKHYEKYMAFMEIHDPEGYRKRRNLTK